jgi:hypothetical protein
MKVSPLDDRRLLDPEGEMGRDAGANHRGLREAAPWWTRAGEIVLLNLQAGKQSGFHRDELAGRKVKSIVPECFAERLAADARRKVPKASG